MLLSPPLDELGLCPFAMVTGKPCVLCGGTRATFALLSGDFQGALAMNAFVSIMLSAFAVVLFVKILKRRASITKWLGSLSSDVRLLRLISGCIAVGWIWNVGRW